MIEKPDVVIGLLERFNFRFDERIKLVERRLSFSWDSKVHPIVLPDSGVRRLNEFEALQRRCEDKPMTIPPALLATYGLTQSRMHTNGVELDVLESGPPDGPLIVLSHGFPELGWSWRHQLKALGEAGWHAIAPDQRGYGRSSKPAEVDMYSSDHLSNDLLGLVDQIAGVDQPAVFVGHDWGAFVVWDLAREHPERVRALINLSVPFVDWPMPPIDIFKAIHGDNFFYILYFQEVGVAEAELDPQVERVMRGILWAASGEGFTGTTPLARPMHGDGNRAGFADQLDGPPNGVMPPWVTDDDLQIYIDAFTASGFFGPVSWYRNLNANADRVRPFPIGNMTMPTWFIGGTKDLVIANDATFESRNQMVPGYRGMTSIGGAGHWTQQERPDEVNAAMLRYLAEV
jgi:pimeloyl-ACP methyl ester carboxylesterase